MRVLKNILSVVSAAALTVGIIPCGFVSVADDTEVTVSFNITEDMTPAPKVDVSLFADKIVSNGFCDIPKGNFTKDGYVFSGWTVNNIDGFLPGDTYIFPKDVTEVVFEPVWYNPKSEEKYDITYHLEYKGEIIEHPEWLKDTTGIPGQIITPDYTEIKTDKAFTRGLVLGKDHELAFGRRFVMPAEDVVITPKWFANIKFIYHAGDVDRINGSDLQTFDKREGTSTELAESDRFSRDGFNLVGWLTDYDNKVHKPGETVICPGVDVNFTAVWEAKTYNVVFKQGNGGANLKVEGKTDTTITCPAPTVSVDGKYFAGWKDESGKIYDAGSEYLILGAKPGAGIMLTAVWNDSEAPATTTTASKATTTAKKTTTTTAKSTTTTAKKTTTTATKATTTATKSTNATSSITTTVSTTEEVSRLIGDANCDGEVNIADATAIVQAIGNKDRYGLSEQGEKNADCYNVGDGVTGMDARLIQQREAYVISEFPVFNPELYMENAKVGMSIPNAEIRTQIREWTPDDSLYIKDCTYKSTFKDDSGKEVEMEKPYNILLPKGYNDEGNTKEYPVLYLNHGLTGDHNSMEKHYVRQLAEYLWENELAEDMIIVFPYLYTDTEPQDKKDISVEVLAKYERGVDDLVNNLKPHIEKTYRVKTGRENTAVAGFSLGGRWTLEIAMKYPEKFGYVASIAPAPGMTPCTFTNSKNQSWNMTGEGTHFLESNEEFKIAKENYPFIFMLMGGTSDELIQNLDALKENSGACHITDDDGTTKILCVPEHYHEILEANNQPHLWYNIPGGKHDATEVVTTLYNFMPTLFRFDLPEPFELYDVNMDGKIDIADRVLLLQMIENGEKYGPKN